MCDKGFIWNPSNCECKFDKSCNTEEYLDYKNCKCRKRISDKLVEKRSENFINFRYSSIECNSIECNSIECL